jgi:hypothetical protein
VEVKGGGPGNKAIRRYKVVKSCGPDDLVFQSVKAKPGFPHPSSNADIC